MFKTDVKSYYASMDHEPLINQCRQLIHDPVILKLVEQYVGRSVDDGGIYRDVERDGSLGCSLSPPMGAVYLKPLDEAMERTRLSYARFKDDGVVLAPARWALRKTVRIVNLVLNQLKVWQHPDKTLVGCVSRGFDFLGYHLTTERLPAARKTKQNHINHVNRLYEQRATSERIDGCVKRWKKWTRSGHGKVAQWSDRDRHGGTWESRHVEHPHRRYRSWRAIPRPHV